MKEATGELSTTVIAIVAIAAVLTLFTTVFLPMIKNSITSRMHCTSSYGCVNNGNGTLTCNYDKEDGTVGTVTCDDPTD